MALTYIDVLQTWINGTDETPGEVQLNEPQDLNALIEALDFLAIHNNGTYTLENISITIDDTLRNKMKKVKFLADLDFQRGSISLSKYSTLSNTGYYKIGNLYIDGNGKIIDKVVQTYSYTSKNVSGNYLPIFFAPEVRDTGSNTITIINLTIKNCYISVESDVGGSGIVVISGQYVENVIITDCRFLIKRTRFTGISATYYAKDCGVSCTIYCYSAIEGIHVYYLSQRNAVIIIAHCLSNLSNTIVGIGSIDTRNGETRECFVRLKSFGYNTVCGIGVMGHGYGDRKYLNSYVVIILDDVFAQNKRNIAVIPFGNTDAYGYYPISTQDSYSCFFDQDILSLYPIYDSSSEDDGITTFVPSSGNVAQGISTEQLQSVSYLTSQGWLIESI